MSNEFSLKPQHKDLINVGSGGSHTNLTNFYDANAKGYTDLQNVGSGGSHTNMKLSGYTYLSSGSSVTLNIHEYLDLTDNNSSVTNINKTINEYLESSDAAITFPLGTADSSSITDEVTLTINKTIDEYLETSDSIGFEFPADNSSPITDEVTLTIILNIDEFLGSSDEDTEAFEQIVVSGTVVLQVLEDLNKSGTSILQIIGDDYFSASVYLNTLEDNLIPITNASSIVNPATPTVIVGGVPIISNIATMPSNPEDADIYVAVNCDILPTTGGELFSFSINLSGEGGTFTLETENSPGRLNSNINLFGGLTGVINEIGQDESSSGLKYVASGILGDKNLYEQVSVTLSQDAIGKSTVLNQTFSNTGLQTVAGIARLIAQATGVFLTWAAIDAPLTDISIEAGQTALEAISSLASRVGAVLRWNGNSNYTVINPDKSSGVWSVPHPSLILSNGTNFRNLVDRGETKNVTLSTAAGDFGASGSGSSGSDLGRAVPKSTLNAAFAPTVDQLRPNNFGVGNSSFASSLGGAGGGTGIRLIPSNPAKDPGKNTLPSGPNQDLAPNQDDFNTPVLDPTSSTDGDKGGVVIVAQQISKINKKLTEDDPPLAFDIPFDYANAFIQILTKSNAAGTFVTHDPRVYFEFDDGIILSDIGGILVPQIVIDHTTFPIDGVNDQIDSGNFSLTLAVVRKTLSGANTAQVDSASQSYPGKRLDTNNDGIPDAIDLNGDGTADVHLIPPDGLDFNGDGIPDVTGVDINSDNAIANALNPTSGFGKASDASTNRQKSVLGSTQDQYKNIKVYQGNISCIFFGSIPIPGMYAQVDTGKMVVSGIVESVSITPPGILNIQVARYQRLVLR